MPRYYIKTYGCQMNVADSAELEFILQSAGYSPISDESLADFILVNTCVVRQSAEDKAAWHLTSMKNFKAKNPSLKIALCGCFVTEPGRDFKNQFPFVDLFIPPHSPHVLSAFLGKAPAAIAKTGTTGYVSIMTGCDNYCSYCVVPYVRGRETSRSQVEVLEEIKQLVEQGVEHLTLLGQNVNSYQFGLDRLLRAIGPILGSKKVLVHFLTSHPRDMSDAIVQAVGELDYVDKEIYLPLQSGDNAILLAMNRGYTYEYYLDRVKKIREMIPNARLITDLMVGFPGETEEQFQNTMRSVRDLNFRDVHMYAFSPRPHTAASKLPDQISAEIKLDRLNRLIALNRQLLNRSKL